MCAAREIIRITFGAFFGFSMNLWREALCSSQR